MADSTGIQVKDIGSRPVGYTLADDLGPIDVRFDNKEDAQATLRGMQELVPPLMTDGRVQPVRGVIKERKGGPGRKSNAEKAALAAQASKPSETPTGNAKPEKAAASVGSAR